MEMARVVGPHGCRSEIFVEELEENPWEMKLLHKIGQDVTGSFVLRAALPYTVCPFWHIVLVLSRVFSCSSRTVVLFARDPLIH